MKTYDFSDIDAAIEAAREDVKGSSLSAAYHLTKSAIAQRRHDLIPIFAKAIPGRQTHEEIVAAYAAMGANATTIKKVASAYDVTWDSLKHVQLFLPQSSITILADHGEIKAILGILSAFPDASIRDVLTVDYGPERGRITTTLMDICDYRQADGRLLASKLVMAGERSYSRLPKSISDPINRRYLTSEFKDDRDELIARDRREAERQYFKVYKPKIFDEIFKATKTKDGGFDKAVIDTMHEADQRYFLRHRQQRLAELQTRGRAAAGHSIAERPFHRPAKDPHPTEGSRLSGELNAVLYVDGGSKRCTKEEGGYLEHLPRTEPFTSMREGVNTVMARTTGEMRR